MRLWFSSSCFHGYRGLSDMLYKMLGTLLLLAAMTMSAVGQNAWESPGCHLLGHVQNVSIPGCIIFQVTTNACRGYCTSYAFPSPTYVLKANPNHMITSRAECCSIKETHDVHVNVRCLEGYRKLTFKSAVSCACSMCRYG